MRMLTEAQAARVVHMTTRSSLALGAIAVMQAIFAKAIEEKGEAKVRSLFGGTIDAFEEVTRAACNELMACTRFIAGEVDETALDAAAEMVEAVDFDALIARCQREADALAGVVPEPDPMEQGDRLS